MATSSLPATSEAVRGGVGILDFYQWKGLNCIRLWPRKPRQPWTDVQKGTVNRFRSAVTAQCGLTPQARSLTSRLPPRPHGTHRAYQLAAALRAVTAYEVFDPVYPYEIDVHPPGPVAGTLARIEYDATDTDHPERTAFHFIDRSDGLGSLTWYDRLVIGTRGNGQTTYMVLPAPIAARRIDDITYPAGPGVVDLRISALFNPTHILGYYHAEPGHYWLLWAMPLAPWHA